MITELSEEYILLNIKREVRKRDNNCCRICGVPREINFSTRNKYRARNLDVHHLYLRSDNSMENLISLCLMCHKKIHFYKKKEPEIYKHYIDTYISNLDSL